MYDFEDCIAWDKAELEEKYHEGYITTEEYETELAAIEEKENEYFSGWDEY